MKRTVYDTTELRDALIESLPVYELNVDRRLATEVANVTHSAMMEATPGGKDGEINARDTLAGNLEAESFDYLDIRFRLESNLGINIPMDAQFMVTDVPVGLEGTPTVHRFHSGLPDFLYTPEGRKDLHRERKLTIESMDRSSIVRFDNEGYHSITAEGLNVLGVMLTAYSHALDQQDERRERISFKDFNPSDYLLVP